MENSTINSNQPNLIAYQVESYGPANDQKSSWNEIGSAWSHNDGNGLSVQLKSFSMNGKIVLKTLVIPESN